jgi:hypothetical protein
LSVVASTIGLNDDPAGAQRILDAVNVIEFCISSS